MRIREHAHGGHGEPARAAHSWRGRAPARLAGARGALAKTINQERATEPRTDHSTQQEPGRLGSRSSAPGQGRAGRHGAPSRRPPRRSRCSYGGALLYEKTPRRPSSKRLLLCRPASFLRRLRRRLRRGASCGTHYVRRRFTTLTPPGAAEYGNASAQAAAKRPLTTHAVDRCTYAPPRADRAPTNASQSNTADAPCSNSRAKHVGKRNGSTSPVASASAFT